MSSDEDVVDCKGLEHFHSSYRKIHGHIILTMCVFGIAGNLINMAVLTHRKMRAPLDAIFTALAISHLLVFISVIPSLIDHFNPWVQWNGNYYFVLYELVSIHFNDVVSLISTWLTLALEVWGLLQVAYECKSYLVTMRRAIAVSFAPFLIIPIVCVPRFITHKITAFNVSGNIMVYYNNSFYEEIILTNDKIIHDWELSDIAKSNNNLLEEINGWIFSFTLVIIPCIALAVLTAWLICASRKRRYQNVPTALRTLGGDESEEESEPKSDTTVILWRHHNTPTSLLVVMSALWTLSSLPFCIMSVIYFTQSTRFRKCADNVVQFVHMISFIYPSVTCYLYCKMRGEFWDTLVFMVKPECLSRRWPAGRGHGGTETQLSMA